jgi:hypothetical protein
MGIEDSLLFGGKARPGEAWDVADAVAELVSALLLLDTTELEEVKLGTEVVVGVG